MTHIICKGAVCKVANADDFASGAVGVFSVSVNFNKDWDGLTKTAVFINGGTVKSFLMVDDTAVIPWECLVDEGELYCGIAGVEGTNRLTTSPVLLGYVKDGADLDADPGTVPTPTAYEQIVALMQTAVAKAEAAVADIATANAAVSSAVSAKNAAETAQGLSEAARDASVLAQAASESARDAADLSASAASTSETNAGTYAWQASDYVGLASNFAGQAAYAQGMAEAAATNALGYMNGAETHMNNAIDAENGALDAKGAAEAAQAAAEAAAVGVVTAEASRVTAENGRVSAESSRVSAESARATAEGNSSSGRVKAEADRVTAESNRVTAENGRVSAESARASAESARVTAEETRAAFYDGFSSQITELAYEQTIPTKLKTRPKVLLDFESSEVWTNTSRIAANTSDFISGKQSFLLTGVSGTIQNIDSNVSVDLSHKNLSIEVKATDITNLTALAIYLSFNDTTFSKYALKTLFPVSEDVADGIWAHRTITPLDWSYRDGATIADMSNVKRIRLAIGSSSGGAATASVDKLSYSESVLKNGAIVFTFDDGKNNIYTNAMPALDKYGYPATVYAITGSVGTSGYMTLSQLKTLRDKGWIIGSHTVSHAHLRAITDSAMQTELTDSQNYLFSNGFIPGYKHMAYPYGESNYAVREKAKTLYSTALSTKEYYFPENAVDPMAIPRFEIKSSLYANVTPLLALLDSVKANNQLMIVYCHNILDSGGDWTPAQFQQIVDYVATIGLDVLTIDDVARMYGVN